MYWCTEEPIWTGVSAHLYQMLQRYILLLCFITLEWRALKCLTALSSLFRSPLHCSLPSTSPSSSHLAPVSCRIVALEWALLCPLSTSWPKKHSDASGVGYRFSLQGCGANEAPALPAPSHDNQLPCHTAIGRTAAAPLPIKASLTAPFWAWPQDDITGKALK